MDIDTATVKQLAERYGLSLVVLFGSQATGKTHARSDTDLGFLSERPKSLRETSEMQLAFEETLKLPRLDFVDLRGKPPLFLKHVALDATVLYEKEDSIFARFKIYALKLYFEAKPLYQIRDAALRRFAEVV